MRSIIRVLAAPALLFGSAVKLRRRAASASLALGFALVPVWAQGAPARPGLTPRQVPAHLVDKVIPQVPVRQWVLSLPIPLRLLLAAQPMLITPVLQVVQREVARLLLQQTGLKPDQAKGGAVTLIQRFGSAANLNIHLHCLLLDGVFRLGDGGPVFVPAPPPAEAQVEAVLQAIIGRVMRLLVRRGVLVQENGPADEEGFAAGYPTDVAADDD